MRYTTDFFAITEQKGRKRLVTHAAWVVHQQLRESKRRLPKPPAIQRQLERAYQLKERLRATPNLNRFALSKQLKLDPSRITQLLNLTELAPAIQKYIRSLSPTTHYPAINDRQWTKLGRIKDHAEQLACFDRFLAETKIDSTKAPPPGQAAEHLATNIALTPARLSLRA